MCHHIAEFNSKDQRISLSRCTHAARVTQQTALQVIARQHSKTTKTAKLLAPPPIQGRIHCRCGWGGGERRHLGARRPRRRVKRRRSRRRGVGCGEGVSPAPLGDQKQVLSPRLASRFLQRAAMLALQALYYSYSNSVRPSHAGIVSKRLHVARCSLHCQIAKCVFVETKKYFPGTTPSP